MSIVVSQLISASVLQLPFVNKQGQPLTNGVVTFYQSDMITLKNVYYQASPGNYIAAPNPLTLSGAGTPMDVNGNDIILFYYPYVDPIVGNVPPTTSQPYFVTVYDEFGTLQFTRFNFPWINGGEGGGGTTVATLENYVVNNRFWRNIGTLSAGTLNVPNTSVAQTTSTSWTTQYNSSGNYYYATLCPDQHDAFSMPDVNYIKNFNGSCTETITFSKFAETSTPILTGDIGPEYYINHNCTADTSGSTLKVYQFPISLHLATLAAEPFSFSIQGQSISGTATVGIYIYQFCGTGVTSPSPLQIGTLTFGPNWTKFTITGQTFAGTGGLTLGNGADDAYYLQIGMPTGAVTGVCNLNFTLPSIYLSSTLTDIPTNSFATYDQIDSVINSPRTGDIRTTINQFYFFGWVPLNNGTIGNASSNATSRANADTWPLYNLIWNLFNAYSTGNSTSSGSNPIAQMYTSAGTAVGYGPNVTTPTTAIVDFNANKALSLTQTMGQVVLGTVPITALLPTYSTTFTASNSGGLLLTSGNNINLFKGMPFTVSNSGGALPTGLSANTIYYVAGPFTANTFYVATSFANALVGVVVAWTNAGSGTQTINMAVSGAQEGEYAHVQLADEVGAHSHTASVYDSGSSANFAKGNGSTGMNTGTTNNNSPANLAFNVTQPGVFYNLFMKL